MSLGEVRPPADLVSPPPEEWEQVVAKVDSVLDLAQEHIVSKFPGAKARAIVLTDPQDSSEWTVSFGSMKRARDGRIQDVRLTTYSASGEVFDLVNLRLGRVVTPMTMASHTTGGNLIADESPLQAVTLAESKLRGLLGLGTDEEEIVKEETKERNLQRVFVEVFAHAGLTFEESNAYADIAWDIHTKQSTQRAENAAERAKTAVPNPEPEEPEMTEEQRERGKRIWDALDKIPGFRRDITRAHRQMEEGKYYSLDVVQADVPKLPLKRRPTAGRRLSSE